KDPLARVVVAIVSLSTFMCSANLVAHAWQLARISFAYVIDMTPLYVPQYGRPADKVGYFLGPYVIRAVLQSTPILVLVPFVELPTLRSRKLTVLLALPAAMLFGICALRANEPAAYALGFPCVYLRYTIPALAPLLVLALASAKELRWTRNHFIFIAIASAAIFALLCSGNDLPLWRRMLLLYGTLAAALATAVTAWRARAARSDLLLTRATHAAAVAIAIGIGTTIGATIPSLSAMRNANDARTDDIARHVPQRFALVGFAPELDPPLALRANHDVEYMDLYETRQEKGWTNFRAMIDVWTNEGRPIFALWPSDKEIRSPWPNISFEEIDHEQRLFRVRKLYEVAPSD
ncbi:MAG: hypothetical protein ABI183_26690, partial [Polyangiaceae bacterium]